jgi:hypothetical protein
MEVWHRPAGVIGLIPLVLAASVYFVWVGSFPSLLLLSLLSVQFAYGLWALKPWAYYVAIIVSILSALVCAVALLESFGVLESDSYSGSSEGASLGFWLALPVSVAIFGYLITRPVTRAFARNNARGGDMPAVVLDRSCLLEMAILILAVVLLAIITFVSMVACLFDPKCVLL